MSLESEDQSSPDKAPETLPEFHKQSKISYTREFLLSLSELDVCKELPGGFDRSILSEFEDVSHGIEDRQRIPGSSLLQGFRPRDYGSSPPTRVDTGNYSRGIHGRWDNRSSGRSDKDSDSQSDLDSDSGRRYGSQSRWPRQSSEHDGLLGSGSFPRPSGFSAGVSAPKALADDQHQLNRTNEPYHPPRPYKAVPHLRRETRDSLNDETFGSTESTSQDRAEEERRRRASFELMRKEQHKALQEKQKLNQSKHRDDFLSDVTVSLEQTKEEKRPLERDNELDGSGTLPVPINDTGNSLPSQIPAYRPLVPPGFTSTILEKNSAPKSIIPNHEKEHLQVGKIEMEESVLHAKTSPIQNGIFNNQEERQSVHGMGLIEQHPDDKSIHAAFLNESANIVSLTSGLEVSKKQLGLDNALDNDEIIELTAKEVTGDKIVDDSNQDNPTSILEKLFGSALTVNTGGPSGFVEHHDIKHDDTLSPNKVKSSKFAHWFHEDAEKRLTDNLSSGGPSDLLSLIVGGEKAESQASDVKATRQIPLEFSYQTAELTKDLTSTVPSATTEGTVSAVLTCEDLEQTILSEYSEKSSTLQLPVQDISVSGEPKTKIDNHASQHLLSLLQKGVGPQDLTPSSNFNIGPSNKLHVPEVSTIPREAKTEDNSDSGKNITLETLFGSAFMKELQSFEAPVSLHRASLGPTRSDIIEPHDGPFPSAIDEIGLNRINRESNILPSNQKQENKLDKFENWLGFENRDIEVGPSKVGPIHGSFDGGVEIQLPEEDNLIAVGDSVNPRNSGFMPAGNSNRGEFLTPNDIAEKLAALSVGFNHERGPYDMMVSERQFYPPQMNQGRPLFPLDSHPHPAHINSQRASFQHDAPPNNQFPASMLRHPFHHHNAGPTRFDLPAHHQMLQQQMQMPGNYPPRHALHEFPRGAHPHPHPHPSNQTSGFMQESKQMQGFPFGHRQQNVGGLAMPLPGPDVSSGGSHPEALQRLLGMEQRANSKQTRPYGANYGHELDMGFRYR